MDYKHTWELGDDSLLIRNYKFTYRGKTDGLSFCKLAWATILTPVVIWFVLIGRGLGKIGHWIDSKIPESDDFAYTEEELFEMAWTEAIRMNRKFDRDTPALRFADWVGRGADRVVAWSQRVGAWFDRHSWIGDTFMIVMTIILAFGVLGLLSFVGWIIATKSQAQKWLEIVGIAVGIVLVILTIIAGLLWLFDDDRIEGKRHREQTKAFFVGIGHGLRAIGHFFAAMYYAVKTRTCPKVVVK